VQVLDDLFHPFTAVAEVEPDLRGLLDGGLGGKTAQRGVGLECLVLGRAKVPDLHHDLMPRARNAPDRWLPPIQLGLWTEASSVSRPMRIGADCTYRPRVDSVLTTKEREYLATHQRGHLATIGPDGSPDVVPVG
jgi:hypothetical protein